MRLRDVDALKIWLRDTVSLISDAEPDDLAKYIVALLKKDKSDKELEELCHKELQVFFKENTMEFLSQLFSSLRTESYLTDKVTKFRKDASVMDRQEGQTPRNRTFSSRDDDDDHSKPRNDDISTAKHFRAIYKDVRSRLGETNSREYRRHRDDHERRERRKRSRSRSPLYRRRSDARKYHLGDLRSSRLKRRSRERSRGGSQTRSPFIQSGFRSAKYFSTRPKSRSMSGDKEFEEYSKRRSPMHSRSSSIELQDDREYRITVPLDNIMKSKTQNSDPQTNYKSFTTNPDEPEVSSMQIQDAPSVLTDTTPTIVMATPLKNQPSGIMPPLSLGFGVPPPSILPPFPAKLIPTIQPIQPMVASQPPPQILQHFASFPPSCNLVPSMPMGLNFQSPQIIISKEPTSRQVVGFPNLNSFPAYADLNSIKNRLGIKLEDESPRYDGVLGNTLLICNIPSTLNNISSINQQFLKFGTITNIQVHYNGSPSSALITFGSHSAAESAYNSSEPVFNNRFIEVLWHQDLPRNPRLVTPGSRRPVKERLGGLAPELQIQVVESIVPEAEKENNETVEMLDIKHSEYLIDQVNSTKQKRTVVLMPSKIPPTSSASQTIQMSPVHIPPMKVRHNPPVNKRGELMQEVMKRKLELERKKRLFFEEQLQKQKSLLVELKKTGLSDEDRFLMKKKLIEMSFESRKLKSELDGSMKLMKPTPFHDSIFPLNASALEMKKQILDAELDLMSVAKEGVDTSELDKKIKIMKKQLQQASFSIKRQGKKFTTQRFPVKQMKPFFKTQLGKPVKLPLNSRLLDRRPKQLLVSGFPADKKNAVIAHLGKFGKMEKFEDLEGKEESIVVTYSTRKEAEKVARMATDFEECKLLFSWPKTSESSVASLLQTNQESNTNKEVIGEDDDDDDDDDDSDTMIELMIEDDGTTDLVENSLLDGESLLNLQQ